MPTYLYFHRTHTNTPQQRFREKYELRHFDYELHRETNSKGEIISDILGGMVRVVIDGFGDGGILYWLSRSDVEENGEIVLTDDYETVIDKFSFSRGRLVGYKLHFDANIKDSVVSVLTIEAKGITTDNGLFFESK